MKTRTTILIIILCLFAIGLYAQSESRSVWDGVYNEEQMKRGQTEFSRNCAVCHGADLNGGEEAPALFGANFMANWAGLTVGDLSERIRVSMPPQDPSRLSRQQNVDIITFILSANSFPAGKTEMTNQVEALKQIKIELKK